jgi:hypothetical protein
MKMTKKELLIHNEKIKYRATFFNNCAVGAFITGLILPALSGGSILEPKIYLSLLAAGVFVVIGRLECTTMLGNLKDE